MPAELPTVLLVRHGETVWNCELRMQGHRDVPLSPRGLEETAALAGRLALRERPVRIVSSDLVRARATADAVGAALGLPVTLDPRLREQSLGTWEGKRFAEVRADDPVAAARFEAFDPDTRPPDGETRRELAARAAAAFDAHATPGTAGPVLLVSHGGAMQTILYRVLGLPLDAPRRFLLPNASVTVLVPRGPLWYVRTMADASHLPHGTGDNFPFA